ncbi:MAG TPA: hypothetical protein VG650_11220 [Mycobacteriales bacterium]|nr:hypothetical protein [Mycobacteriales bacterium]
MTQPRGPREPALVLSVVAVALIGAGVAVAVARTADTSAAPRPSAAASPQPSGSAPPGAVASPAATAPPRRSLATQPAPSSSAKTLLATVETDALAEKTVHAVARTVSSRIGTAVFDDVDTTSGGVQHISIYGGHVTVRVVGPRTYFKGDKRGLTHYMGFTADEVAVLHHQWLLLRPGQAGYQAVTEGVTLASTLHEDRVVAPLHLLAQRMVNGVPAVGIRGQAAGAGAPRHATATLWVTTGDHPLPVEFVATNHKVRLTQTFNDWGRPIHLAPPANVFGEKTLQG